MSLWCSLLNQELHSHGRRFDTRTEQEHQKVSEKIIRTKYIPVQTEINNDKENIQQY